MMTLEDVTKLFLFYDFFPKLHILATKIKQVVFWPLSDLFWPWRTSWLKRGKKHKRKLLHHGDTYLKHGLLFKFSVRKCFKMTNNWKKLLKRNNIMAKIACMFSCVVHPHTYVYAYTCTHTKIINQLRRPILKYTEILVKIQLNLSDILSCVTFVTKTSQTDKQTDTAQIYIRRYLVTLDNCKRTVYFYY